MEKYNPATDTWCEVSPMATPCRGLGAAILEGILYVVGGSDGIAALNRVGSLVSGMHLSFACAAVHSNFSLGLHFLSCTLMSASISHLHTYPVPTRRLYMPTGVMRHDDDDLPHEEKYAKGVGPRQKTFSFFPSAFTPTRPF